MFENTSEYVRRVVDDELDELLPGLPALSLEGPKGVGKTSTALQRAATVHDFDQPTTLETIRADISRIVTAPPPILIDEWQRYPPSWDAVRRAVDADPSPGRFILTGSASPLNPQTHSGAGRIVPLRMRPLTLSERGVETPTVGLSSLLAGTRERIDGATEVALERYVDEILASGFPAIRRASGRARRKLLEGYVRLIADRDFPESGRDVRNPVALRRWMAAYAAATSTTTSYAKIHDAATIPSDRPATTTTISYRDTLERIWILDPVPAWLPTRNHLSRLNGNPKHQLADPALAAVLLDLTSESLLSNAGDIPAFPRDGTFLGALFESLVALTLRVFAQACDATVGHLRTRAGEHEIDFIVERADGRIVAIEVKLAQTVEDKDVRHLQWLADKIGDQLLDAVVVTTGPHAYRRQDGIAVVPAALLGP
jgi:uncharacterized protein